MDFYFCKEDVELGKTHLAVSILRETSLSFNYDSHSNLIQECRNYRFKKPIIVNEEQDSFDYWMRREKKAERYEILKDSPFLCIDEFGFVNHSQDEAIITFNFIDYSISETYPHDIIDKLYHR